MVERATEAADPKRELAKLRREARKAERDAEAGKQAVADLEAKLHATRSDLEARDQALAGSTKELAAREAKLKRAQREAADLKKEAADKRRQLAAVEKSALRSTQQAETLKQELDNEKKASGRLREQVRTARREAKAARDEAAKLSQTASQSERRNQSSSQNPGKETRAMNAKNESSVEEQIVNYEHAKTAMNLERRVHANRIVSVHSAMAAGVGIVPVAVVDVAGLVTIQLIMLSKLADAYKVKFSGNLGRTVVSAILGSLVPTSLKATTIGLIRSVPLFGPLLGLITMPAYCWAVTYAIGTVFTDLFEQNKDLESIDIEEAKAKVKKVLDSVNAKHAEAGAAGAAA